MPRDHEQVNEWACYTWKNAGYITALVDIGVPWWKYYKNVTVLLKPEQKFWKMTEKEGFVNKIWYQFTVHWYLWVMEWVNIAQDMKNLDISWPNMVFSLFHMIMVYLFIIITY